MENQLCQALNYCLLAPKLPIYSLLCSIEARTLQTTLLLCQQGVTEKESTFIWNGCAVNNLVFMGDLLLGASI